MTLTREAIISALASPTSAHTTAAAVRIFLLDRPVETAGAAVVTSPLEHLRRSGSRFRALLLFLWVQVSGALRRVRGRSSQVKGAFGVATRGRCAAPCDLRASATPSGRACGQAGGLPRLAAQRARTSGG